MIRVAAAVLLLALVACNTTPDPAATATARDIDAGMRKAVEDTDAARSEATAARPLAAREQTPK